MAVGSEGITGPRLEFVLRKLSGTVQRAVYVPPPEHVAGAKRSADGNVAQTRTQLAGYMLFLPTGHCYRLSEEQARRQGFLDREPSILGYESANSPKTQAVARFKLAVTDSARKKAYAEMEKEVIDSCLKRTGSIENTIYDYDPKGKVNENVAGAA